MLVSDPITGTVLYSNCNVTGTGTESPVAVGVYVGFTVATRTQHSAMCQCTQQHPHSRPVCLVWQSAGFLVRIVQGDDRRRSDFQVRLLLIVRD
jgi:hypothetical protein